MTRIHYFPRYSQRENFATNNTLLLLYRLYDSSRFKFESFLAELLKTGDTETAVVLELGLQLVQQMGTVATVLDGCLYQNQMRIAIETKMDGNSFRHDQLRGHFTAFKPNESGWLLLLSPDEPSFTGPQWSGVLEDAASKSVTIVPVTFQKIVNSFRKCLGAHDEDLQILIEDYEEFCSFENLLPSNQWTIFTPPCGRSFDINKSYKLYFCPSSWSRRRVRFLGIYNAKAVRLIGEIVKVIEFDVTNAKKLDPDALLSADEEGRITSAAADFGLEGLYQFHLCDEMIETDFKKDSPGGIMGHRYLDIRAYLPKYKFQGLSKLAEDLRSVAWS